jgi:hypothetical protein
MRLLLQTSPLRAERRAAPKPARTPSGGARCTHRTGGNHEH